MCRPHFTEGHIVFRYKNTRKQGSTHSEWSMGITVVNLILRELDVLRTSDTPRFLYQRRISFVC